MTAPKFEVGDVAIERSRGFGGRDIWHRVARVTDKGTIFTMLMDSPAAAIQQHRGRHGLRHATAREIDTRAWRKEVPAMKHHWLSISDGRDGGTPEVSLSRKHSHERVTEKILREMARELEVAACWMGRKP